MVAFMKLRILIAWCLLIVPGLGLAADVELNPEHPDHYTVVEGDTLWGIAGKFLAKPWQWPEIWRENPHIANPHWIYPGDELVLDIADGRPRLQVARRFQNPLGNSVARPDEIKLVPSIRVEPLQTAIPLIPLNAIQQFLMQTKVVEQDEMDNAPYIVGFADEHILGGAGDRIYARGLPDSRLLGYMVFRSGPPYRDAETGEILGYEALYVADVEFQSPGNPSVLLIKKSNRDARIGDRILPVSTEQLKMGYQPHAPATPVYGHIISVVDGVSQIGQYSVVAIDRGTENGIETGHVLEIRRSGKAIIFRTETNETINIPSEKEGFLIIFRPYARISFGLVMNATRAIQINDVVQSPL